MLDRNTYFFKPKTESIKQDKDEIESLINRARGQITGIPLDVLMESEKEAILELLKNNKYKQTIDYLDNLMVKSNDEGLNKRLVSVSKQLSKIMKLEKPKNENKI